VPVATVAVGGGRNAGLLAVKILATSDDKLRSKLHKFMDDLAAESRGRGKKLAAIVAKRP
jgi:5-(carboxyamino)imidazole ribonucleotide mutase